LRIELRIAPLVAVALLCGASNVWADAHQDYVLNCMGCHMVDGSGAPPTIPRLKDRVGYYLTIPDGRAYLVQVPGAANSLLDDHQLTDVLNWMVDEFAGASRPQTFAPYATEEVARYRSTPPNDIDALRHRLSDSIVAAFPNAGRW
jgi:hypothetical protein